MLELLLLSLIGVAGLSFLFDGDDDDTEDAPDDAPEEVIYDAENNLITGTSGDDTITPTYDDGDIEDLTIDAAAGDDVIDLTGDPDDYNIVSDSEIDAGDGDDTIALDVVWGSVVNGGDGDDTITARGSLYTTFNGGDGDDHITPEGSAGPSITVNGGAGDDVIDGSGTPNGNLNGGDGDDTIFTGTGGNIGAYYYVRVDGGAGDDTIIYDAQDGIQDQQPLLDLTGGEGADTYDLTIHHKTEYDIGDETDSMVLMDLLDFEPGVDDIQMNTLVEDADYTVATAELEEDTDAGITNLIVTYEHPTDGDIERIIEIHATGVTWDDITFVGDTPPADLLPLVYV